MKRKYGSFPNLKAPDNRGHVTITDIVDAKDPQEHGRRVMQWAQVVWAAYAEHQQWVEETIRI